MSEKWRKSVCVLLLLISVAVAAPPRANAASPVKALTGQKDGCPEGVPKVINDIEARLGNIWEPEDDLDRDAIEECSFDNTSMLIYGDRTKLAITKALNIRFSSLRYVGDLHSLSIYFPAYNEIQLDQVCSLM